MSLATNPWANPAIGGPRKLNSNPLEKVFDTVGDVASGALNLWFLDQAAKRQARLAIAPGEQERERESVARKTQPGAEPGSSWASSTGPRKIGGPDLNQDNTLMIIAAVAAVAWLVA